MVGTPLPRAFYERPTLVVARELVGKLLVHRAPDGTTAGTIVEVEAYIGEDDPACHAAAGRTARTAPLYGPPGRAYVYLNYGMHHLLNAVTEAEGFPAAVLIRAVEPMDGVALMRMRRRAGRRRSHVAIRDRDLGRGPGNVGRAMGVGPTENEQALTRGALTIRDLGTPRSPVVWTPRIGVSAGADRYWRCAATGSRSVSGTRRWLAEGRDAPWPGAPPDATR